MLAPRYPCLHQLECDEVDDGRVALLHEVTGELPRVGHFLCIYIRYLTYQISMRKK